MPNHYTTIALGSSRYDEESNELIFSVEKFNQQKDS